MTLTNRTGRPVTGALLRFDRELVTIDAVSKRRFSRHELRMSPADTLSLQGGTLERGARVAYALTGANGTPALLEGRWLVDGKVGPRFGKGEAQTEPYTLGRR